MNAKQKYQLVKIIGLNKITMAIGDGVSDLNLMPNANISIYIYN